MLGSLLDKIFVACSKRDGELPSQIEHHPFRCGDSNPNWVCFLPRVCYRVSYIRKRLIQEGTNMDVYVLPNNIIQPNPELTRKFLDDVLMSAIQQQNRDYSGKEVNILGISLGNVLAFRFAENFQVNKLISVVPGSRLAECIWESIATNGIVQNSGRGLQNYKRILAGYNPIESVSSISPTYTEIHLGIWDLMIPYFRGKELAEEMKLKSNVSVKYAKFSGHAETVVSFSRQFPKIMRAVSHI